MMDQSPTTHDFNAQDGRYLLQAIAWSRTARAKGNRPFGAIVVASDGSLLAEAYCDTIETGDCTGHAETNAVRIVSKSVSREVLKDATIYSSGEPCVMCAGAIYWSNIRRVVFGIDAASLRKFRGDLAEQRDAELSCRDVFAASPHAMICIGPVMLNEATEPHIGFWKI